MLEIGRASYYLQPLTPYSLLTLLPASPWLWNDHEWTQAGVGSSVDGGCLFVRARMRDRATPRALGKKNPYFF